MTERNADPAAGSVPPPASAPAGRRMVPGEGNRKYFPARWLAGEYEINLCDEEPAKRKKRIEPPADRGGNPRGTEAYREYVRSGEMTGERKRLERELATYTVPWPARPERRRRQ